MENVMELLQNLAVTYGFSLLWAILTLIFGWWAAGLFSRMMRRGLTKANIDPSLVGFASNITYFGILTFVVLAALGHLGVQTTSIVAVVGAAGLAVGLALQGALSNFAAGVLILIFRPIKVGDFVEVADAQGFVEEIQIFTTILVTRDNKTVIIPNGQITDGNIVNYSKKGKIRVDMVFGIGYDDDILKAKNILKEIIMADERVFQTPSPVVALSELGDSSVNFTVRPYVKVEDYWPVQFTTTEKVKLRFDEEGISIPYPQRDVHLFSQNGQDMHNK